MPLSLVKENIHGRLLHASANGPGVRLQRDLIRDGPVGVKERVSQRLPFLDLGTGVAHCRMERLPKLSFELDETPTERKLEQSNQLAIAP